MSKVLVRHLWEQNRAQVLANSIANCHARGVHSLMLLDEPGKRIRLFVATEQHELWKNEPGHVDISVGFHPHHCAITIEVVQGVIWNRILTLEPAGTPLSKYLYRSKLRGEEPGFERIGTATGTTESFRIQHGEPYEDIDRMSANDLHTIHVRKGEHAAWLIYEGREDPNYQPICYSTAQFEDASFVGMYEHMSEQEIAEMIALAVADA